mmetsp:Transcript_12034/g.17534  ORF Transcript_12034/g.17534 Transcript_12034/m.17534 type:complete len:87 (+) Transcript_12034:1437-1697(+)
MFQGSQSHHCHYSANKPEHIWVVIFISMIGFGKIVSNVGDNENDGYVALGQEEIFPAGPAGEDGRHRRPQSLCGVFRTNNANFYVW